MGSSNTEPFEFCTHCFNQITNPKEGKRYPAFPSGAVALKCGEKNPIGPQNIGELSFTITDDGKLDQISIDTYQGRPSFGSDHATGSYQIVLLKQGTEIFSTKFEPAASSCRGNDCVIEGQTYPMTWKAILPSGVRDSDILKVSYLNLVGDIYVYGQTTINGQPPVADAGPDLVVECTGSGQGIATLDASESSDPDGDILQYTWSAPGITFVDPNGETPTAVFPLGATDVTLTVKDGSLAPADTDVVTVTVQDTTPPVLTPPAAITIFTCAGPNIGTATAVDTCGGGVTITNNAPAIFTLGENIVTWSATDIFGNTGTATQKVVAILGDDPSCCPARTTILIGTNGDDDLIGTFGNDCILGLAGNDSVNGKKGNDYLSGGAGPDTLVTDNGSDYLASGPGRDNLNAGKAKDICVVDHSDNVVNCETIMYYP